MTFIPELQCHDTTQAEPITNTIGTSSPDRQGGKLPLLLCVLCSKFHTPSSSY